MDKRITQQPKSKSFFDDDDEDDQYDVEPHHAFNCNFSGSIVPPKPKQLSADGAALIAEIGRKIKEHTESVVYAVGGLSARVSQLESRTRQLETAVGDLKDSVEFNHARIDGKVRELGNILGQVQGGIRDLRDKHEIAEAQLQLAKLTLSKVDQSSSKSKVDQSRSTFTNSAQELSSSLPQQSQLHVSVPATCPQQLSPLPSATAPNVLQENISSTHASATAPQLPPQFPPGAFPCIPHPESNHLPPTLTPDTTFQQQLSPLNQQMQQALPAQPQPYQPLPQLSPIPQMPQWQQQHSPPSNVNSHISLPFCYQPKDNVPYLPSQSTYNNSSLPPARSVPAHESFVSPKPQNQDLPSYNPYPELPSKYSQPHGHSSLKNQYLYGASSPSYNSSTVKSSQLSPSSVVGAGSSFSRLPSAQILPHALPTASVVDSGSGSSESGNRVPVDDVIDKVVAMGFRRDLVRATVRKLTANGQSVDLNVVLDKLMNNRDV